MNNANHKNGSRHGKHHPDNVILGCFVKPEFKALAMMVANAKNCDVAALLVDGVNYHATQLGFMENGKLKPEVELVIRTFAEQIRKNKKARQMRGKSK